MVKKSIVTLYVVASSSSLVILAFSLTSLFSPNWSVCTAIRNATGAPDDVKDPPNDPFSGLVTFGVIYGHKQFNYGYGARDRQSFLVFQEYDGVFETSYVIVSLVFMVSTVIFAGVSLFFGVINAKMVPIETIHGRPGLFLWNGIGLFSGLISTSIFAVLYANELKFECLSEADREDRFSTHRAILGYSFWFLVVCDVLFLVNLLLVYITQLIDEPPKFLKRRRTADINVEPPIELKDGIMY
ncbi:uncharacterized protein LOC121424674 [Lytechinus variegatus]|uniref:uncharacterized protein LOC121424643 n=1 Tax=Lytechinus variegatus TaxID=7654 RepID=UPI001BB129C5|nr:uncharacterized protein LOC121424643 [Lytechinus variegatus]XP_041476351.1 uncharacterized protein LOC121424674 [Lytechinus variegatus]